ncbi:hypothetical protein BRM3_04705 [Brachybacterium huguangmaarense]|uniref:Uncharacterized protein n=1 Tax=Brachybacterium huguangmaarense TaxID=1652028 RepID=A0ABY6G3C8_9MICO|nr:hypothetical protein [Brachybacterium huguangmaarense]UYG17725.1 hypothetical protein BRM3_04705 [Brachybacterium huguangmaarense]
MDDLSSTQMGEASENGTRRYSIARAMAAALAVAALAFTPSMASAENGARTDDDDTRVTSVEGTASEDGAGPSVQSVHLYVSHAEYPHKSGAYVSGHGFWSTTDAKLKSKKAHVKTWLQMRNSSGKWVTIIQGTTVDVYPGSGKGKRGVAKIACKSTGSRYWRTITDVDIDGMVDTADKAYSKEVSLPCTA